MIRRSLFYFVVPPKEYTKKRSLKWAGVRRAWLQLHPQCAACGSKIRVAVHHIMPYHLYPDLELDLDNLITLCENKNRICHFIFGHFYDWHRFNKDIREDAPIWRKKFEKAAK